MKRAGHKISQKERNLVVLSVALLALLNYSSMFIGGMSGLLEKFVAHSPKLFGVEESSDVRRHGDKEVVWHIVLVSMKHFCIRGANLLSLCKCSNKNLIIRRSRYE